MCSDLEASRATSNIYALPDPAFVPSDFNGCSKDVGGTRQIAERSLFARSSRDLRCEIAKEISQNIAKEISR
jgi:hypothetical protein